MKRFLFLLGVPVLWLGFAHAQTPGADQIKLVFGKPERFQAIMKADKITACVLETPPKAGGSGPVKYKVSDYIPGPEKELPDDVVIQFREALSRAVAIYDEEEEPAGWSPPAFRYRFRLPDQRVDLYFISGMSFMYATMDDKPAGRLWVCQPAVPPLSSIAESLFPTKPSR